MQVSYDKDCNLSIIQGMKVSIIGYGSQGHAHALNLKDSGVDVTVGLRDGSTSAAKAKKAGLTVRSVAAAVSGADLVMILTPDEFQSHLYKDEIEPNLKQGAHYGFCSWFCDSLQSSCPSSRSRRYHDRSKSSRTYSAE